MSGVYQLEIKQSVEELKELLAIQKTATCKERVQLLYLLKTGHGQTISQTAEIIGRNRVTLHKWIRQYKAGGIEELLKQKSSPGRPRTIPQWAEKVLAQRLQEPQGFNGYQEIVEWLEQNLGVNTCYKTVHKLVYYRLESYPKVPRPKSVEQQQPQVEAFKKTLHTT
ncbi:helix-turn-helix domain-containing protein [Fischerella sp. PCC 9605]|uniref:helix-turn-helix domain-containing protein n=1 Tax=Fischerella sp. PCC 9605 TaxID=1173024 RepID=UPI00047E0507|nr:helix-turn-helix domain-containing protein [Fischerella sp. PCC 9605]